jgi:hypothetical protein
MALYKRSGDISASVSDAFDKEYGPGNTVPHSGIFRCLGCGREIASNAGTSFPPQNHHQHSYGQGAIRWRMAVYSDGDPK